MIGLLTLILRILITEVLNDGLQVITATFLIGLLDFLFDHLFFFHLLRFYMQKHAPVTIWARHVGSEKLLAKLGLIIRWNGMLLNKFLSTMRKSTFASEFTIAILPLGTNFCLVLNLKLFSWL